MGEVNNAWLIRRPAYREDDIVELLLTGENKCGSQQLARVRLFFRCATGLAYALLFPSAEQIGCSAKRRKLLIANVIC